MIAPPAHAAEPEKTRTSAIPVASGVRFRPPPADDAGLKTGAPSHRRCVFTGTGADGPPPGEPGVADLGAPTLPGTAILP
jgi:hypothetical protein